MVGGGGNTCCFLIVPLCLLILRLIPEAIASVFPVAVLSCYCMYLLQYSTMLCGNGVNQSSGSDTQNVVFRVFVIVSGAAWGADIAARPHK